MGKSRSLYSSRHMYAAFRLSEEESLYLQEKQIGTSVEVLEHYYVQFLNRLVLT